MRQEQIKTFKDRTMQDANLEDYTQSIVDIVSFCQTLCKQTHRIGERLRTEVMRVTQGRARLSLHFQDSSNDGYMHFPVSVSFAVRFCNRIYGTLDIAPDPSHPASPAFPLPIAQLLAQTCGSLLYNLELAAFIEGQCQRLDYQIPEHLTRREREVLALICRGYDLQTIATKLHIATATVDTYQKRIREKFGIHSEHDIALSAYQTNLFSILE